MRERGVGMNVNISILKRKVQKSWLSRDFLYQKLRQKMMIYDPPPRLHTRRCYVIISEPSPLPLHPEKWWRHFQIALLQSFFRSLHHSYKGNSIKVIDKQAKLKTPFELSSTLPFFHLTQLAMQKYRCTVSDTATAWCTVEFIPLGVRA